MDNFLKQHIPLIADPGVTNTEKQGVQDSFIDKNWPLTKPGIQKVVKSTANDVGILLNLSVSEIKEKIESSTVLSDFFEVNNKGEIIVKSVDNSNGFKGHFPDLPICPGVALKELFKTISGIDIEINGYESVNFLDLAIPGNTISIKEDGLYINGTIIMSINNDINPLEHTLLTDTSIYKNPNKDSYDINDVIITPTHSLESEIDTYLFQAPPFRFASSCDLYLENGESIQVGDIIKGSWVMPHDFKYLDKNGEIDLSLLPEINAQILSFGILSFMNKGIENDGRKKLLTFANSTTKTNKNPGQIGKEFFIECEITSIDDKLLLGNFRLLNAKGVILQEGSIKGGITPKKAVRFMHASKRKKLEKKDDTNEI
ncbi:hypothetical protein EOM39_02290 [Candidatus Gracilibacteria bacterium]|nr:hypothetical protein [Candidatus Gracilibacteria bacterium]